jgi:hypothetical protein
MTTIPRPNPETVSALLDTTWRLISAETARTEALDRKASAIAGFASLVVSLTATLGIRSLERVDGLWSLGVFLLALLTLVLSVGLAVTALLPREYLTLGIAYVRRFPKWSEIVKPPEQVRGETMRGLVEAISGERDANAAKTRLVRGALVLLLVGLVLVAVEASTLAIREAQGAR